MRLFKSLLLLPMALLLVVPAHATTPSLVTGTITGVTAIITTIVRTADNNTFGTITATIAFAGGIQGEGSCTENIVLHNSTMIAEFKLHCTFEGTVMGRQNGSMEITSIGSIDFLGSLQHASTASGNFLLGDGAGGLAGIHGEGTLAATFPSGITYSVNVHFDPA